MGEALLSRNDVDIFEAIVKVSTKTDCTVKCTETSSSKIYQKATSGKIAEVVLPFGEYNIEAGDKSKIIKIDKRKIYEINFSYTVYGIAIDMSNTDPESAVTYTDDAVGFTPLYVENYVCNYGSWEDIITDFIGCRPCIHKGTARTKYLNPNDYSKYEDGTAVGTMSSTLGNVMVEFKKLWYKYEVNGDTLTFRISDINVDGSFVQSAFKSMDGTGIVKDYMYYGAYEGYNESNAIYSWSGKTPTRSVSYTNFRTYCKANGSSYGMEDWCKRYYILGLLMLVTKTRGIQEAIGNGICDCDYKSAIITGTMDTEGLFYGGASNVGVKCFGIENMWGNYINWCDGIITLSYTTVGLKDCPPYNDTGSGYTSVAGINGIGCPTSYGVILDGAAILHSALQSDYTIGWCEYASVTLSSGYAAYVGGFYGDNLAVAGPFYVNVSSIPSYSFSNCSVRSVAC